MGNEIQKADTAMINSVQLMYVSKVYPCNCHALQHNLRVTVDQHVAEGNVYYADTTVESVVDHSHTFWRRVRAAIKYIFRCVPAASTEVILSKSDAVSLANFILDNVGKFKDEE